MVLLSCSGTGAGIYAKLAIGMADTTALFSGSCEQLPAVPVNPHPRRNTVRQHVFQVALALGDLADFHARLRRHALVSACLQKLADPYAAGVTRRSAGRQNVIGANRFVAISHGSLFANKQRTIIGEVVEVE